MNCRFCEQELTHIVVSLGCSPLANAFLSRTQLQKMEPFYPLTVYVCDKCFLVQLDEFENPREIFSDYAYFSSYSTTWLHHAKEYVENMIPRFKLDRRSFVIEIASNDGYLLQYFVEHDVPVLGIEPACNVATAAQERGIPTKVMFFGTDLAERLVAEGKSADLLIGNNVLAHVPDLNDFVRGLQILLKPNGVITMEFPHLMRLIENTQFDTIYHEHFSYFSLLTVENVFAIFGLTIFDVEELSTHGGSLRMYVKHEADTYKPVSSRVAEIRQREQDAGYTELPYYLKFHEHVKTVKRNILRFLIQAKDEGENLVGYGAAAKGNTLLNYCGIRTDFLDYVSDKNPYKQGRYLPGSHIPIETPERIRETKPDYVVILPWNIQEEIMDQLSYIREWGGQFVVLIPDVRVM